MPLPALRLHPNPLHRFNQPFVTFEKFIFQTKRFLFAESMSYNYLPLDKNPTNFQQIKNLLAFNQLVSITFDAHDRITECRKYLDEKLDNADALFYGINTGFGFLQNVKIDKAQLQQLQSNLIKSHACGMGEEVPADIVKLMIMLKIKSLSYGHSGVQIDTVKD